ncbi:MAG: hypothetical protein IKU19_06890, partial [Clostridia bacterium]|nr:hypothetical protein [Clostridia bacterium]
MVQMDSGKVYTDFIIQNPQNTLKSFKPQLNFAHKHFDTIWCILQKMSDKIAKLPFVKDMGPEEKTKLDRFAILKALQDFQFFAMDKIEMPNYPARKDGGHWVAQATAFDAGYNMKEYNEASEYVIQGGHRSTEAITAGGTRRIRLYEFDTTLWDNPHRFCCVPNGLYFKHIIPFLWCIYADIPLEERPEIPNELISHMPSIETVGLIGNTKSKPCVKIPVLKSIEYEELYTIIKFATSELKSAVGDEFWDFIISSKTQIPKHLTSVPKLFRYIEATNYFVMAIVREAYNKGLHLKDIDYCCPPVIMVWWDCEE